jgi:hypothetical protein
VRHYIPPPHSRCGLLDRRADLDFEEFLSSSGQLVDEQDDARAETILETEFLRGFSTDALADELAEAIKWRLSEIEQKAQTRTQSPGSVRFWWCSDGTKSAGCPSSRDAPVSCRMRSDALLTLRLHSEFQSEFAVGLAVDS